MTQYCSQQEKILARIHSIKWQADAMENALNQGIDCANAARSPQYEGRWMG